MPVVSNKPKLPKIFGEQGKMFNFDGMKILVSTQELSKDPGKKAPSKNELQKLAESYRDLNLMVDNVYGKKIAANGPLIGNSAFDNASDFHFHELEENIAKTKALIAETDKNRPTNRLPPNQHDLFSLFNVNAENGTIFDLPAQNSFMRGVAKKLDVSLLPKFDCSIGLLKKGELLTVTELIPILKQMKETAVTSLEAVDVEATVGNVADYMQMLHLKTRLIMKDSLSQMSFLKVDNHMDKNLARMVGRKLRYEHLVMFFLVKKYPTSDEELDEMLELPKEWLFNLIV